MLSASPKAPFLRTSEASVASVHWPANPFTSGHGGSGSYACMVVCNSPCGNCVSTSNQPVFSGSSVESPDATPSACRQAITPVLDLQLSLAMMMPWSDVACMRFPCKKPERMCSVCALLSSAQHRVSY